TKTLTSVPGHYGLECKLSNAMKNYPGQLNYESFMWLINNTNLWYKDFRYSYNDKPENMRATAGIFSFVMQNYQVLMEERNRPIFEWLFEVKYSEDGRFKNGLKNIDAVVDQSKACLLLRALKIEGAAGNIGNISILFNADTAFLRGLAENEDEEALRQAIFELKIDGNEDGDERRGVKRRFFSTYLDNYGPLLTEIGHFKSSVDQLRSTINMEQDYVKRLQDEIRLLMLNNNDASVEGNPDIDNPEERNEKLNALVQRLNGQMTLQQGMVTKLQAQIDSKTAPLGKCVFCQEDLVFFEDGSNAALKITKAKCGLHTFHEKCVLAALTHGVDACPLCNKPDTLS
ncbi:E3 ubiquitin protein ligase, partial [Candidatus Babeliales bacterium]|nr:E3 ubiquitin protein ligase [Candidatus Babeliales bacterium]